MNSGTLPKISIVIPVKPGRKVSKAIRAIRKADYPSRLIEIILAYGYLPSRQRNEAIKKAKGSIIYFLDNDSEISKSSFKIAVAAIKGKKIGSYPTFRGFSFLPLFICRLVERLFFSERPGKGKIAAAGGPNIWERKESFYSSLIGIVLESFFGHWKMSSRYRPIGKFRRSDEKELILCNLAVLKKVFEKLNGFKEELYPNEENEFLNRLIKRGFDCIYHPGIIVYRPRRKNIKQFVKAFFSYGRGRMEQIRIEGFKPSITLLLPLLFLFYLITLIFMNKWFYFIPLIIYLLLALNSAIGFTLRRKRIYFAFLVPVFFFAVHIVYSLGLLSGLFTGLNKNLMIIKGNKIRIKKVKKFGKLFKQ